MYEPQSFLDLQDGSNAGGADPKSWLSAGGGGDVGDDYSTGVSSPSLLRTLSSLSSAAATAGNVDQRLFNDLVEMVPLVQSLIESKQKTSFTRRGSVTYTKTPSRDSLYKKTKNAAQSIPTKKHRDQNNGGNFSMYSSRSSLSDKDNEELIALRDQVEDLQSKLSEKDELLKSSEITKEQMTSLQIEFDELKHKFTEKENLLKSTQLQLSDVKIKLADKHAAVERLNWEAMTSNKKAEKLQQDLDNVEGEMSMIMMFADELKKNNITTLSDDYDVVPNGWDVDDIDGLNELEMVRLEEAREAYVSAVKAAKEKQDEESIAEAAKARVSLQSFVMPSNNKSSCNGNANDGVLRVSH